MVHFLVTWNFLDKLHQNKLGKFSKLPFSVSFFLLTDLVAAWLMKIQIMQAGLVRSVCPRKVLQQFQTSMSDCLVLESWLCVPMKYKSIQREQSDVELQLDATDFKLQL